MPAKEAVTRWWDGDPAEIFWLEITDRQDLGVDLHAPAAREEGGHYWSYAFVREVREGDVVLHYRARPNNAITHWSRAVGEPYHDRVRWGAHGQASGRGPVNPYWRPGWRHPLDGPYELREAVTATQLQECEPQIRELYDQLRAAHPDASLYFPFQLSDTRPLRAFQGYLTKFPRALVGLVPQLEQVQELAQRTRPTSAEPAPAAAEHKLGADYRHADPNTRTARRQPFSVDPDLVDRALEGHARTQEALAQAVTEAGMAPRSPRPGEPAFDLAWEDGALIVVAEVKSLTDRNEEKQLRLALGQVLRYAHLLGAKGRSIRRVIATEREPSDGSWSELCSAAGVTLVWPETFAILFSAADSRPTLPRQRTVAAG
ncbi:MAG: hypothetical protein QOE65_1154 [Solirubrobacteraceae bacterium]|jgi:hypothetical protein|nr:hypothetical protein [Solirubrobacteraceae bacterium]